MIKIEGGLGFTGAIGIAEGGGWLADFTDKPGQPVVFWVLMPDGSVGGVIFTNRRTFQVADDDMNFSTYVAPSTAVLGSAQLGKSRLG